MRPIISPANNPFWRAAALELHEQELLTAVLDAHYKSAFRENVSSVAVRQAAFSSGDYTKAIGAALMTLGGVHAPIIQTMEFLARPDAGELVGEILSRGQRVPGWGSSFEKTGPDKLWREVDAILQRHFPERMAHMDCVTAALQERGRKLFPNPSAYTAIAALALGMPSRVAPYLFVMGRLQAWSELFTDPDLQGG